MARATEQAVKEIIDTTLTNEDVTPFLRSANVLVTAILTGQGYSADLLRQIEMWLAAHFVAVRDPRVSKEKLGDGDATYHGKSGLGLNHTPYGQQAMLLDHNGILKQLQSAKGAAEIKAII